MSKPELSISSWTLEKFQQEDTGRIFAKYFFFPLLLSDVTTFQQGAGSVQ